MSFIEFITNPSIFIVSSLVIFGVWISWSQDQDTKDKS